MSRGATRGASGGARWPIVSSVSRQFIFLAMSSSPFSQKGTYVRQTTVSTGGNLGLICVDENPGVTGGAAAAVASDNTLVRPPNGLLVDELHRRVGLGLEVKRGRGQRRAREMVF